MAGSALLTSAVGSYPKPDYLMEARVKAARGQVSPQELQRLERQATEFWIRFQDEIGMDILVDGEMYRGDMAAYFAENLEGFEISGPVRSYGNRYYDKPIAIGKVRRAKPITVEWWKYAQSLTKKPVKGMLTGPYTIADWSFDEHYGSREEFIMALAEVVRDEAKDLEKAGAEYIQIDEPAICTHPEEMELASRALGVVTKGLKAYTVSHTAEYTHTYAEMESVFDQVVNLPVNNLDLEMANSNYFLLELLRRKGFPKDKVISAGVLDVHDHRIEPVDKVKQGIRRAMEVVPADRLWIKPDCGLKTRTVEEAQAKLRVMVQAVNEIKQETGLR